MPDLFKTNGASADATWWRGAVVVEHRYIGLITGGATILDSTEFAPAAPRLRCTSGRVGDRGASARAPGPRTGQARRRGSHAPRGRGRRDGRRGMRSRVVVPLAYAVLIVVFILAIAQ
jgi:hypothetical protein